jgi:hypothetical protein
MLSKIALHFEERPYVGKSFRPRPEVFLDEKTQLLIVATPWGARSSAKKVIEKITEYLALAREDEEATSPFDRLSCLSTLANDLRIAILLANEVVYREDNKDEYRAGVEVFAAMVDDCDVVWAQAGGPQILLGRHGRGLLPIGSNIDLAFDMSEPEKEGQFLPALPSQLLGLDSTVNLNINSFRCHPGDRVVLLAHSHLPQLLFSINESERNVDTISKKLASSDPDLAFWVGILTIASQRPDEES